MTSDREVQRLRDDLAQARRDLEGMTRERDGFKTLSDNLKRELELPPKNARMANVHTDRLRSAFYKTAVKFEEELDQVVNDFGQFLLEGTRRDLAGVLRQTAAKYTEMADKLMAGLATRAEIIP